MSGNSTRILAALKAHRDIDIISELEYNREALEKVTLWIVQQGHDKLYRRCQDGESEGCIEVGLRETFHGYQCPSCRKAWKRKRYEEETQKKKKKKGSQSGKRKRK